MALLLIGDACPYRNCSTPFRNSQGRAISSLLGVDVDKFLSWVTPIYLVPTFVPEHKRRSIKFVHMCQMIWDVHYEDWKEKYNLIILVGKRLQTIAFGKELFEFNEMFKLCDMSYICIPNPLSCRLEQLKIETSAILLRCLLTFRKDSYNARIN